MIFVFNLPITSWLIIATSIGFPSTHAYTNYQVDQNGRSLSYDKFNDALPPPQQSIPFNDRLEAYYSPDGDQRSHPVVEPTAPPRSSSMQRDGWMPIIRSQPTRGEHEKAKIQLPKEATGKRERTGSPRQSRTSYLRYAQPKQQRQFQHHPTAFFKTERNPPKLIPTRDGIQSAFRYAQPKKDKQALDENDIMWMHYGPPIGGHRQPQVRQRDYKVPEFTSLPHKISQKSHQLDESDEYDDDKVVQAAPKNIYQVIDQSTFPPHKLSPKSYQVEESNEYDDDKVVQAAPKNIYQVIDQSTYPTFTAAVTGLTKRQTSTQAWPDDEASIDRGMQTYKFGFEDRLIREPAQSRRGTPLMAESAQLDTYNDVTKYDDEDEFTSHSSNTKYVSERAGFVNFAASSTSSPTDDESLNAVESIDPVPNQVIETATASTEPIKSGRLLNSPIVIVDPQTTTLTPEYYRQLFDSFSSGHYRQADIDSSLFDRNQLRGQNQQPPHSSTPATMVTAAGTNTSEHTEPPVTPHSLRGMRKQNETEKSNSVLFTMTSHQLMDLLPETLKVNLIAVKRVLIDCYSLGDKNETTLSSVNCFKKITFDILDKAIESDVVRLTDQVSLVKDNKTTNGQGRSAAYRNSNQTEWLPSIIEKIQNLFSTHALKVNLMNSQESDNNQVEGRRRNRHTFRRVFPVVASIYMMVTSVLMPLVFQFMAVMAGKSFMVGKIALLFALFTGFNKFLSVGFENILPWYLRANHESLAPPPPPPSPQLLPVPYPVPSPPHHDYYRRKDSRKKDTNEYNYPYTTQRMPTNYTYYTLE